MIKKLFQYLIFTFLLPVCMVAQVIPPNIDDHYEKAEELYKYDALHLALRKFNFLDSLNIDDFPSDLQLKIGECYKLKSHILYDIGYIKDYEAMVDSMYKWKSTVSDQNILYKAEYYAYRTRFLTIEQRNFEAREIIDSALIIINQHKGQDLIDENFVWFNFFNVARNYSTKDEADRSYENRLSRISLADSLIESISHENTPFYLIDFYHRVRSNLYQDLNFNYLRHNKGLKYHNKTINFYQESQEIIHNRIGYLTTNALGIRLTEILQHTYLENRVLADSLFQQTLNNIQIEIDGKSYYRDVSASLYANKWITTNLLTIETNLNDTMVLKELLTKQLELRKLYNHYLSRYYYYNPEFLIEGYRKGTFDEIITISYLLYTFTNNDVYLEILWNHINERVEQSLYEKMVQKHSGEQLFYYQRKLDSIITYQMELLDELFLSRKGALRFNEMDTISIKKEIQDLDIEYDSIVTQAPYLVRSYLSGKPLVSLAEYQNQMNRNEALITYYRLRSGMEEVDIAYVVTSDTISLTLLPFTANQKKNYLDRAFFENPIIFQKMSYSHYSKFLLPIKDLLIGKSEIAIMNSVFTEFLPFDMLISDTLISPTFKNLSYLGMNHRFRYIPNVNVEYLLKQRPSVSNDSVLIIAPSYEGRGYQELPFNHELVDGLSSRFYTEKIESSTDLKLLDSKHGWRNIHVSAHGVVGFDVSDIRWWMVHRANEKYLVLNDTLLPYSFFSSLHTPTNLVVFNSCNSASGYVSEFDGKIDFSRAMILAGAKSTVTTPWELDDQSSADIMRSFYKYLEEGKTKTEALHHAKLDFWNSVDDPELFNPLYWAGFMLAGDDSPIAEKPSENKWIYWILGLLGLVILVYISSKAFRARSAKE